VTIGNFDGVHRGHQELLAEVKRRARGLTGPAVAVTFHPHPLELLRPEQFQPLLTAVACRAEMMLDLGADHVVVLIVSHSFLQRSAHEFFDEVIVQNLHARIIVEGPNFGFGHNREGNLATLKQLCTQTGQELVVVPRFEWQGKIVSSSRVRQDLLEGDVGSAAELLGRPFRLLGVVGKGAGRGQKLGFPTANLEHINTLIPCDGVYAVRVLFRDKIVAGAANIGPNPTFGEQKRKVEVHLLVFNGDLYGKPLALDFLERLRNTRPFAGAQDLVEQLKKDVEQVRLLPSAAKPANV
jgi:riboflavin kinase/FMN adenylyltransferase